MDEELVQKDYNQPINAEEQKSNGMNMAKAILPDVVSDLKKISSDPKAGSTAKVMALSKLVDLATLVTEEESTTYEAPTIVNDIKSDD